jgi:hypothetical protein
MTMKRLITFACSLALVGACSNTPAQGVPGDQLTSTPSTPAPADSSKPVATSGAATTTPPSTPSNPIKSAFGGGAEYHDVTLPAGTVLPVDLETAVGSATSRVEQPVSGRLRRAVTVAGAEVLPAGTVVSGHVTGVARPGKVKGRGMVAMRFTQLDTPGAGRTAISTATISRLAPATKEMDTLKVVAPATAGAVIGRIVGGKSGAAKGAVIGGGAGAGYVLSTRGKDVQMPAGSDLAVKLTAPVTVRVAGR